MLGVRWMPMGLSLAIAGAGAGIAAQSSAAAPPPPPLAEVQVVSLPGVERRIDHMAIDPVAKWLYVSALGNHSLEVIDVGRGTRVATLANVEEPQGVAVVSSARAVVAARGGTVTA